MSDTAAKESVEYLANSKIFASDTCTYPYNKKEYWISRDYFEFLKLFNAPTVEEAEKSFRKLLSQAKTPEAKAWAYYGLFQLGKIKSSEIPEIKCRTPASLSYNREELIHPRLFFREPCVPSDCYAEVDFSRFNPPSDLLSFVLWGLCNTKFFATGGVFYGGSTPFELWAANYIVLNNERKQVLSYIDYIISNAKNHEGKLYAVVMLLALGEDFKALELYNSLPKDAKIMEQVGYIGGEIELSNLKFENLERDSKRFLNKRFLKSEHITLPFGDECEPIAYDTKPAGVKKTNFSEAKLPYLPMRYRVGKVGLIRLVRDITYTSDNDEQKILTGYLQSLNLPFEKACLFENQYPPKLLRKVGGKFCLENKYSWFDEYAELLPCFNGYFENSEEGNLARKLYLSRLREDQLKFDKEDEWRIALLIGTKDLSLSRELAFAFLNKTVFDGRTCYLSPEGVNKTGEAVKGLLERFRKPVSYVGVIEIDEGLGMDEDRKYPWLLPIFSDTPEIVLQAQAELFNKRLASLEPSKREFLLTFFKDRGIATIVEYADKKEAEKK